MLLPKQAKALDMYNAKPDEPESSVMESLDYDFATQKYSPSDFRHKFVENYMKYVDAVLSVKLYNCKFERPKPDSNFLNFYIYYSDAIPTSEYRIENTANLMIQAFFGVLEKNKLPEVDSKTHIQFIQKSIKEVMLGRMLNLTWNDIHEKISTVFPDVCELSYWSSLYIFISADAFNERISDCAYLESLKKYCYTQAKKQDKHHILSFEEFHIRVDNYHNYHSIGGQHYFNSGYMFDCLLL